MIRHKVKIYMVLVLLAFGCGKDDPPPPQPPSAATLVFPASNSECTTGEDVSDITSRVTFQWNTAANTDSYELVVTNLQNNFDTQKTTVSTTSASLDLKKGAGYEWTVTSKNQEVTETAISEKWFFFNEGAVTENRIPFPASAVYPKSGSAVSRDANNEVILRWKAGDVDNDIIGLDVFLDTQDPPQNLLVAIGPNAVEYKAVVNTGTTYFWQVQTKDSAGNKSKSAVFEFRVN
ncbi:fibronectin type III domain-containing protein [Sediminicola luteus]|uniref:Fibronectin type-III domain-containing protein n=1 Tax=Sediminicola luteus TaxID=319238 RepID=A0A2A4GEE8_9FLAO|nr:hypothetical protein [Sediminicola luteus]PCE66122.1 hypothetical protein B7P33_02150 [Sediminicola luteus]